MCLDDGCRERKIFCESCLEHKKHPKRTKQLTDFTLSLKKLEFNSVENYRSNLTKKFPLIAEKLEKLEDLAQSRLFDKELQI